MMGKDGTKDAQIQDLETKETPFVLTSLPKINEKQLSAVYVRTLATLAMVLAFIVIICAGPVPLICMILGIQMIVYREVTALFGFKSEDSTPRPGSRRDRWSTTLNWYWFVVVNHYLYGETIIYYFKHVLVADVSTGLSKYHRFISFCLYVIGFVGFVANLRRQHLKRQFGLFCWVHMSILLVVVSGHFVVTNLLEGIVWFLLPVSLVITNDIFAYVFGITMGRTPLIQLSPKKTVEGFIGGAFSTLIAAYVLATILQAYPYMICPPKDLGANVFTYAACQPNAVFTWHRLEISPVLQPIFALFNLTAIPYTPFQGHALNLALFASLFAPFGGFFASGFKRAFDLKDFGQSIPGHGGMADRMDCQFLMGIFSYMYYASLIRQDHPATVESIFSQIQTLGVDDQFRLFELIGAVLQ